MQHLRLTIVTLTLLIGLVFGAVLPSVASPTTPDLIVADGEVGRVRCANGAARAYGSQVDGPLFAVVCIAPTQSPTATALPSPTATVAPTFTPSPTSTPTSSPTSAPTATVPPTATIQPELSRPSANLAWFWRPGADGFANVQDIAKRSTVIALQKEDLPYLKALRAADYDRLALQYFLFLEVRSITPAWGNNWAWNTGDYSQFTDDMFLRRADGSRVCGGSNGMCLLDPGSLKAQTFIESRVIASKSHGFDGIILDNLRLRWSLVRERAGGDFYSGTRQRYATEADFLKAELQLLQVIRRANGQRPLWANMIDDPQNGTSWDLFLPYLDGGMHESFATGWPLHGYPLTVSQQNGALRQAEKVLSAGKGFLAVGQGKSDDVHLQQFFTASWMLITDGSDRASLRYSQADPGYGKWWLYPSYDLACGKPLGPRTQPATGWQAREFQFCTVKVDQVNRRGYIVQHP